MAHLIREEFERALSRALFDIKKTINDNVDVLFDAAKKQANIDIDTQKDRWVFPLRVGVKIDSTNNVVETSLSWDVKEKRETAAYVAEPHPNLFGDAAE